MIVNMIPDHLFDEGLNNTYLQNDMKHVQKSKTLYEKSQRDYEQEQRDMLSSQDGDTCEIHDQFYRDHKLLLVLFRALAVMPITRSRPGTITFSWRSSATTYAICFYIAATVVVLIVGYERIMILRSIRRFDDYIYAILFVVFLVPHFWIPFVGWGVAHQVAIYKTNWGKFQEQEQRDMLSSQDGDTCEIHDQFYRDHKLLLVLFRALAVMPITRSRPGTITFSWRSSATTYAICFYIAATVVVLIVGYERIMILRSIRRFDDYIYAILFVVFLVPHFWIPFVGWGVAHQVAIYKTNWGKFQVRYYRVTGENLQFPNLKTTIVIISVGCLLLAVCFLLSLCALLDGFLLRHTTAYYHIITMINMNCALWYINCRGVKIASQSLSDCFRRDVDRDCSASLIARYRYLWLNLSELLQLLGNAYARTYSTYCLFMFANITIAVYGALSEIVDHGFGFSFKEIGLFVDAAYCSTLFYIFVDCSHKSTLKVASGIQDTLLSIDVLAIDRPTQKEVDHFIQAIEMNPAVVSLKGYAHVNRELLTSAVSMIAIYLIVLLQFKISLPKEPKEI